MSSDSEKRSSESKTLPPGGTAPRVGGRCEERPLPQEGGGYLDVCTSAREPIGGVQGGMSVGLEDLRQMGLDHRWLVVAERVGVDNFLVMWRALEESQPGQPGAGRESVRVRIPSLSRLRRRLRNRWIRELATAGHPLNEIRRMMADPDQSGELCERLSVRHISRIIG